VDNTIATGGWTNDQAIRFVTITLKDSTLKWNDALSSHGFWTLKTIQIGKLSCHMIKSYGTQINTTAAYKVFQNLVDYLGRTSKRINQGSER
jgi:hypothetical protein